MKTKTIRTIIEKKMEAWLSTIADEELRKQCRRDLIVTGGSIASMLLREKINDFDVYFKTKETVEKISNYYVKQINEVYLNRISESKIDVINSNNIPTKDYEDKVIASQWTIFKKGLEDSDEERIKIYIPHIGYWRKGDERCSNNTEAPAEGSYLPVFLSENAISLSDDVQLIVRFFGPVEEIHKNYDFSHATNYCHYTEKGKYELILLDKALESLLTKELNYIGSKYPLTSIIRTKKFLGKGYNISAGTYLKILWQVAELDLKNQAVLQEQLMGVDVVYFSLLIEAISKTDPKNLTYNFIAELIDRIFSDFDGEDRED